MWFSRATGYISTNNLTKLISSSKCKSCVCIDLVLAHMHLVQRAVVIFLTFYLVGDKSCYSFYNTYLTV